MGLFQWCALVRRTSRKLYMTVKVSVAVVKIATANWIKLKKKVLLFTAE